MKKPGLVFMLLAALSLAGLVASGWILKKRVAHERADKTVQIVVDYPSILALSPDGESARLAVERLTEIGVYSFGVFETRIDDLVGNGSLEVNTVPNGGAGGGWEAKVADPKVWERASSFFEAHFGPGACDAATMICRIPALGEKRSDFSFGIPKSEYDFRTTPRPLNTPFEKRESIALKMKALDAEKEPSVVIFDGSAVMGSPTLMEAAVEEMKRRGDWAFGMVEMTAQEGARTFAKKLPGRVLVAHSISAEEIAITPQRKAVERFRRAARERGVRVLYVRFYSNMYGQPARQEIERNIEYVGKIADALCKDGFVIGKAEPQIPLIISKRSRAAAAAGAVAFVGLLCAVAFGLPAWISLAASVLTLAAMFALPETAGHYRQALKLVSLGVGALTPALAIGVAFLVGLRSKATRSVPGLGEAVARWAAACAITLAGAAFAAALLSHRDFFLRLDSFSGVKVALLVPLVLVAALYLRHTGETLTSFLESPVRKAEAAACVVLLAVVALYLLRSGNEAGGAVTSAEGALRSRLEGLLSVRPRFKEFAIGHPAMLLIGVAPLAKRRYAALVLLFLGVIGQASLFNTFCHLHTPLEISYIRTILGMILGLIIGVGARTAAMIFLEIADVFTLPRK